ncbi:MAG: zinc ribbon domain-containing protein [Myxococcales bacterium]|nr:zinc ribbon domain-containing protein [Myxococcales bacterium]MCB9713369.1 zinc ribbon domain-containing protein [Myxococcales bacterium]
MLRCPQCSQPNPLGSNFCEACGASLAEVADAERMADEAEASVLLEQVKKARVALFIVGGALLLGGALAWRVDEVAAWTTMILAAIFFGLAVWAKRNPFAAAVVGLVAFLSLVLANLAVDPSTLTNGIVIKVIAIAILLKAVRDGLAYRAFRKSRGL